MYVNTREEIRPTYTINTSTSFKGSFSFFFLVGTYLSMYFKFIKVGTSNIGQSRKGKTYDTSLLSTLSFIHTYPWSLSFWQRHFIFMQVPYAKLGRYATLTQLFIITYFLKFDEVNVGTTRQDFMLRREKLGNLS